MHSMDGRGVNKNANLYFGGHDLLVLESVPRIFLISNLASHLHFGQGSERLSELDWEQSHRLRSDSSRPQSSPQGHCEGALRTSRRTRNQVQEAGYQD
jgi:hypothetical protein